MEITAAHQEAGERAQIGLVPHQHHGLIGLQRGETLDQRSLRTAGLERRLQRGGRSQQLLRQEIRRLMCALEPAAENQRLAAEQRAESARRAPRALSAFGGQGTQRVVGPALGVTFPRRSMSKENDLHPFPWAAEVEDKRRTWSVAAGRAGPQRVVGSALEA